MEIIFFDEKTEIFLTKLEKPTIAKVLRMIDMLEHFGNQLGMPHSRNIDHNLFELRIRSQQEIRLIYTFHRNKAIILHGFVKKSQKMPKKEIIIARQKLSSLDTI
ncbi:MAG: type II toxin-antitoxin system RelE/ParE family toxin [Patescibacteria group bacterium]